jgi:PadR family transcriptional regulator, regulatory protein PadR
MLAQCCSAEITMNLKGSLPLLVLHLLAERPAHGYELSRLIKQRSDGVLDFREGTLYPALHALEDKGWIASSEGSEQGRTRRSYRLTEAGHAALAGERAAWRRFSRAVDATLGEA